MRTVIKLGRHYVARFDSATKIVQLTEDIKRAKQFAYAALAVRFLDNYADAGYGLPRRNSKIVSAL